MCIRDSRTLEGSVSLGRSVTTVRSGYGKVRIDCIAKEPDVSRLVIERQRLAAGVGHDRETVTAIRPCVAENIHLESSEVTLRVTADTHVNLHRVTRPGGDELLFAGQLDLTREARFDGSIGHKVVNEDLLLGAKTTADSRLDDCLLAHGKVKNP